MERFICDAMLGRLARWLRVLGYDTVYDPSADDADIVRRSWIEGRTILTRDTRLVERKVARRHLLIRDDEVEAQLRQAVRELGLKVGEATFSRCIICNDVLREVPTQEARGAVPPYVYATQTRFSRCPTCGRHYWQGTHWQRMMKLLESVANSSVPDPRRP